MITIWVNNMSLSVVAGINLAEVLNLQQYSSLQGIAVAINNVVIPKTAWFSYILQSNDKITIIKATQGG